VVKQRARFGDAVEFDGLPAEEVGAIDPPGRPTWALAADDLPTPTPGGQR
jgi:hypothetical protein